MKHKAKRYAAGGETDEDAKKGMFSGSAAEDDSDTYAPKTRTFSETGPEKKKSKPATKTGSGASGFPLKEKEKAEKPVRVSSGASGFPIKKKEKAPYEGFAKGGVTRGDGIAQRGKTRGKMC